MKELLTVLTFVFLLNISKFHVVVIDWPTDETVRIDEDIEDAINEEKVWMTIKNEGLQYPHIVMAQAILETNHFKSDVCKGKNNLFGMRNSKGYHEYYHWSGSIRAYKKAIQSRYKNGEDYYSFLKRIHYAEDPQNVDKLKSIVKRMNHEEQGIIVSNKR